MASNYYSYNNNNNMKGTVIPFVVGALGTVTKGLVKILKELEIRSRDLPKFRFVKIGQNTEKSPGDLRRLFVTQVPVENH